MRNPDSWIGKIFTTKSGRSFEHVANLDERRIVVRFIESGNIQIIGKGSLWEGVHLFDYSVDFKNGMACAYGTEEQPLDVDTPLFRRWNNIITRCHVVTKPTESAKLKRQYQDVEVCEEWHCFNVFKDWFDAQYAIMRKYGYKSDELALDKDLFSDKGARIYSPETCCLIPIKINSAIGGLRWINGKPHKNKSGNFNGLAIILEQYADKLPRFILRQIRRVVADFGINPSSGHLLKERVKTIMQWKEMDIQALAISLRVAATTLMDCIYGDWNPHTCVIKQIARALGVKRELIVS